MQQSSHAFTVALRGFPPNLDVYGCLIELHHFGGYKMPLDEQVANFAGRKLCKATGSRIDDAFFPSLIASLSISSLAFFLS